MTSWASAPALTDSIWFQPSVDAAANFSLLPLSAFQVAIQSSAPITLPSFQTAFGFSFMVTTSLPAVTTGSAERRKSFCMTGSPVPV